MITKYLFNPGELITENYSEFQAFIFGFIVSGFAFSLFFLQTALDTNSGIVFALFKGILFGTAGIALISVLIWLIIKASGGNSGLMITISSFAMSYSTTLIFTIVGLMLYIFFDWKTSVSCGITGVLSAFGPMNSVIINAANGKKNLSILIMSITGIYILLIWGLLNNLI